MTDTCRRGHPRTPENSFTNKKGIVVCRVCRTERQRHHRATFSEEGFESTDMDTATHAKGPVVAAWVKERGLEKTEGQRKRLEEWRDGFPANYFTIDALLVGTSYNLCDLPDDVWLRKVDDAA